MSQVNSCHIPPFVRFSCRRSFIRPSLTSSSSRHDRREWEASVEWRRNGGADPTVGSGKGMVVTRDVNVRQEPDDWENTPYIHILFLSLPSLRVIPFSRGTTKECNERNGMREGRSDERVRERTGSHHSSRRFLSPAHTSLLSLLLSLGALYVHPSLRTEWVRSEGRKERVTTRTTGVTEGWAGWKGKERQWRDRPSRLCFSRSVHPCPSPPVVLSCRVPCPSSLHTSLHPAGGEGGETDRSEGREKGGWTDRHRDTRLGGSSFHSSPIPIPFPTSRRLRRALRAEARRGGMGGNGEVTRNEVPRRE